MTGGCRRLGAAIAAHLARSGWDLALHAHSEAYPSPELAAAISAADVRWDARAADFSDLAEVEALLPALCDAWGRVPDLLVNSASLFGQDRLTSTDAAALTDHFAVDCAAATLLIRDFAALSPGNATNGIRSVVNILDQRIVRPHDDQFAYTVSKIALAGVSEIAAHTFQPAIRVNAVAPGLTLPTADYAPAQLKKLAAAMPLKRLPSPRDVAEAVLFLARSRGVTGQVVFVDSGARLEAWDGDFVRFGH